MHHKLLVICGPTATGKSALAVEIAKQFHGEIISVDSRQVYRGLDIGSAKITLEEMQGIPHYLIDVADPQETFTVAEFQKLAQEKIADIQSRDKLPILCGGTGFYISAVIDNTQFPEVPPSPELRAKLEQLSTDELVKQLNELDPKRLSAIDTKNKVRIIRAIEIATMLGKVPQLASKDSLYNTLFIGLELSKEELVERIKKRINDRIPALFDEIKSLHTQGISWERLESFGLEYRYGAQYVQNKIDLKTFKELLATKTWQFTKRQMTWFKRDARINWFNPILDREKILKTIKNFL